MSTDTTPTAPPQGRRGYPPLTDLRRSSSDRKIAGVAGGLGRYAGVDPLVFRVLLVVLAIFGGSGFLLYALGWLLVPADGESESEGQRLLNGRSTRSVTGVLALVVVVVVGIFVTGTVIDSGPGLGGLGLLVVIVAVAVLVSRTGGPRSPAPGAVQAPGQVPAPGGVVHGPVPPPAEPGAYGQTPGTAYAAAMPSHPVAAPAAETATFAPPPSGPTYPVYTPMPPAPPRPRSVLGRVTLSLALIVVGLLVGWNAATDSDVPARVVFAASLGVVGLGLVVGAFAGRARGLVVWGVVLTAVASAAAFVPDVPVHGGVGDRTWRPTSVEQLRSEYRLGIGDAELDLSQLDLSTAGRQRVAVRQGVGDLTIIVPDGVVVRIDADVQAGEIRLPDMPSNDGTDLSERVVVPEGSSPASAVLVVDAELGLGSLEVRRAAS